MFQTHFCLQNFNARREINYDHCSLSSLELSSPITFIFLFSLAAALFAMKNSSSDDSEDDELISTTLFFFAAALLVDCLVGLEAFREFVVLFEPLRFLALALFVDFLSSPSGCLLLGDIQPSSLVMARVADAFCDFLRVCRSGKSTT